MDKKKYVKLGDLGEGNFRNFGRGEGSKGGNEGADEGHFVSVRPGQDEGGRVWRVWRMCVSSLSFAAVAAKGLDGPKSVRAASVKKSVPERTYAVIVKPRDKSMKMTSEEVKQKAMKNVSASVNVRVNAELLKLSSVHGKVGKKPPTRAQEKLFPRETPSCGKVVMTAKGSRKLSETLVRNITARSQTNPRHDIDDSQCHSGDNACWPALTAGRPCRGPRATATDEDARRQAGTSGLELSGTGYGHARTRRRRRDTPYRTRTDVSGTPFC
ncbi:hypothetical protein WN48_05898 [Eufriesea mexicana]|uniref:Uncharacterized protein n=1 Tax=Eufriesea mexicana TaxID=516756 RepID=A0A310S911_9HYME|nr:hypothetical protein WN48_05898 [Eufriesea mexicana]